MRSALALLFAGQFVLLDLAFQSGPRIAWLESITTCALVLLLSERRVVRVVAALVAAFVFVSQVYVFRFYHVPLDVQVAASALHQWGAIKGVIGKALPGVTGLTAVMFALELAVLSLAHGRSFRAIRVPVMVAAALAGLLGGPPRRSTPEIRALNALWALHERKAPVVGDVPQLPPLYSDRNTLPHVLVVLSESIRADDYDLATAPECQKIPGRVDLRQMRAIASYTALSFSAVVTGRSQEGPRADILRSPSMFDYAHAVRDPKGRHFSTAHVSGQSEEVFEAKEMRTNIDDFTAAETIMGHDPEEDDPPHAMDDVVVDALIGKLPKLSRPIFAFLHFTDTHAPYYVDPAHAPFVPYDHITA